MKMTKLNWTDTFYHILEMAIILSTVLKTLFISVVVFGVLFNWTGAAEAAFVVAIVVYLVLDKYVMDHYRNWLFKRFKIDDKLYKH